MTSGPAARMRRLLLWTVAGLFVVLAVGTDMSGAWYAAFRTTCASS